MRKAFALNLRQAKKWWRLPAPAVLMEALWSKFLPQYQKFQELIASGELGEIKSVLVNFDLFPGTVPSRLYDPALEGAACSILEFIMSFWLSPFSENRII